MSGMVTDKTVGPGESQKGARLENKLRERDLRARQG